MVLQITSQPFNAFTHLIKPIFDYYNAAYKKLDPSLVGSPLHDVFTIFALVNPEQVQYVNRQAFVSINFDNTKGESIADFRARSSEQITESTDHIAISFNYEAFVQDSTNVMATRYR